MEIITPPRIHSRRMLGTPLSDASPRPSSNTTWISLGFTTPTTEVISMSSTTMVTGLRYGAEKPHHAWHEGAAGGERRFFGRWIPSHGPGRAMRVSDGHSGEPVPLVLNVSRRFRLRVLVQYFISRGKGAGKSESLSRQGEG